MTAPNGWGPPRTSYAPEPRDWPDQHAWPEPPAWEQRRAWPEPPVWEDYPRRPERRRPRRLFAGLVVALLSASLGGVVGGYVVLRSGGNGQLGAARDADNAAAVPQSLVGAVAQVLPGVVSIQVRGRGEDATGSGFVIDDAQHVVTNAHVVAAAGIGRDAKAGGGTTVTVLSADGRERPAQVVGRNARIDIAVLRIASSARLRPVALGRSADVRVGEAVLAVGSPLGLAGTVTAGIVSAVDREVDLEDGGQQNAVQTDASINPGNSGGPLVNAKGQVIGVNTAIASIQGGGSIGIGFAIPIDRAAQAAQQLIRTG
jgi:putative serine protease PepD